MEYVASETAVDVDVVLLFSFLVQGGNMVGALCPAVPCDKCEKLQ